ncbi:hypothetical protein [Thermostichus vulcanus]|uniref:Uncharacterized protein n=1 Tax=Thermostichus vulcanus str. 'Rupite' TaxID=2813851 RepID=A0ABT0CC96_THEVL|nr:hypothetical protein [Thermostichus vulcanus]MCJ2543411.1 hypothetical protein [Thermostichus vulcanus str. 'Rupite']
MVAKQLKFYWSPQHQLFSCDGAKLEGHGYIQTNPSHDLVHLLIAANGNMPWQPVETREQTCFAEYNAVMLEHLLVNCFNTAAVGSMTAEQIIPEARKFLKWFVSDHYAPFPVSEEEAFRRFAEHLDIECIVRLFPYFYNLRAWEWLSPDYRNEIYDLEFTSEDDPVQDSPEWAAETNVLETQELVRQKLTEALAEARVLKPKPEPVVAQLQSNLSSQKKWKSGTGFSSVWAY